MCLQGPPLPPPTCSLLLLASELGLFFAIPQAVTEAMDSSAFLPQEKSLGWEEEGWKMLGLNRMNAWTFWQSCNSFCAGWFPQPFTVHLHFRLYAGAEGAGEKQAALLPLL